MELQDLATRLGLALALGFVIGLERGWRERDEKEGQRAAGQRLDFSKQKRRETELREERR